MITRDEDCRCTAWAPRTKHTCNYRQVEASDVQFLLLRPDHAHLCSFLVEGAQAYLLATSARIPSNLAVSAT